MISKKKHPQLLPPRIGYNLWASSYGEDMNPVQTLEKEALLQLLPDLIDKRVLDVGCGRGRNSRLAMEHGAKMTVGLDISDQMVLQAYQANSTNQCKWILGTGDRLPIKDESFDVVLSSLMMGHCKQIDSIIEQFASVLVPDGSLLISDFHPYATLRGWVRSFRHGATGKSYQIEQHLHLFEKYFKYLTAEGFLIDAFLEPVHDGFPIVFALRAVKGE